MTTTIEKENLARNMAREQKQVIEWAEARADMFVRLSLGDDRVIREQVGSIDGGEPALGMVTGLTWQVSVAVGRLRDLIAAGYAWSPVLYLRGTVSRETCPVLASAGEPAAVRIEILEYQTGTR